MSRTAEIPAWLTAALDRMPMPDAPITDPWDFSARVLLTPHMPRGIHWLAGKLDAFGAIRISRESIGIDSFGAIRWRDVTEVRCCPLREALTGAAKDTLSRNAGRLVPGARGLTSKALSLVTDTALGILCRAEESESDPEVAIPREIVHRARLRRNVILTPGPVATAMFALPAVAASILETAAANGIPLSTVDS